MTEKDESGKKGEGVSFDFGLGGLFKGLTDLIETANRLAEKGEEIHKTVEIDLGELGKIKGLKDLKAVYGVSVRTMGDGRPSVSQFGNIRQTSKGPVVEPVREPMVDLFESPEEIQIIAEMPGVEQDDIRIQVQGDILTLSAEAGQRKYSKEVLLPRVVTAENMNWTFKNGVLEIRIKG
jgi:HSP20 family protein